MHFTKIRLTGLHVIDLPISNALPTDPYILKDASGLGPPGVDVFIQNARDSKAFYQNKNTQLREVVLRVGLNPNYALNERVSDLREKFYGMLTTQFNEAIRIEIMTDDHSMMFATGHVKQLEIAPFSQTPELQITIVCVEKYFRDNSPFYLNPTSQTSLEITNNGSAPSGFHIELLFSAKTSSWAIIAENNKYLRVNYLFQPTDRLVVDTTVEKRGVWMAREGQPYKSILSGVAFGSSWLMLSGGLNKFTIESSAFIWGDVYYTPQYWGI